MSVSIKRIMRDLIEISKESHPGYTLAPLDSDELTTLHGTIRIPSGVYEGCYVHLIIKLPYNYPYSSPFGWVMSDHPFNHHFHEHVRDSVNEGDEGFPICFPLFGNFAEFIDTHGGMKWKPSVTLHQLMTHLAFFFTEPDLPLALRPTEEEMKKMIEAADKYVCPDCEENSMRRTTLFESSKSFPPLSPIVTNPNPVCSISKTNREGLIFGLPCKQNEYDDIIPLPGLIGEDTYMDQREDHSLISADGLKYNLWLPVVVNDYRVSDTLDFIVAAKGVHEMSLIYGDRLLSMTYDIVRNGRELDEHFAIHYSYLFRTHYLLASHYDSVIQNTTFLQTWLKTSPRGKYVSTSQLALQYLYSHIHQAIFLPRFQENILYRQLRRLTTAERRASTDVILRKINKRLVTTFTTILLMIDLYNLQTSTNGKQMDPEEVMDVFEKYLRIKESGQLRNLHDGWRMLGMNNDTLAILDDLRRHRISRA